MIKYKIKYSTKKIIKILKFLKNILIPMIFFISFLLYFSANWIEKTYGNIEFNEILFHILVPIQGTEKKLFNSFLKNSIIPTIFTTTMLIFLNVNICKNIVKEKKYILNIEKFNFLNIFHIIERQKDFILSYEKILKIRIIIKKKLILIVLILIKILIFLFCIFKTIDILNLKEYFEKIKQNSNFIEQNYIDPKKIKISFPKKKQNLILIFVESLESSFLSENLGGIEKDNLLSPLTKPIKENINFSDSEKFGGAFSVYGANFTSAGIVAQTLAIPLKVNIKTINNEYNHRKLLKKAYGLGDILKKEGYSQLFMLGSDIKFGNKDSIIKNHGNCQIFDYFKAIEKGYIKKNHKQWWGIEDSKLFEIAKKEIICLQKKAKPFICSILTSNTHFPGGYVEKNYKRKFKDKYSDSIFSTCEEIAKFLKWAEKQTFYKNTTIVITGDHLSMEKQHFLNLKNTNKRRIFNLFINSKTKPIKTKNRKFTSFDILPSTIASLGAKIEGERLGLGTNLFSNEKTLAEKYDINKINEELKKESLFYYLNFIV